MSALSEATATAEQARRKVPAFGGFLLKPSWRRCRNVVGSAKWKCRIGRFRGQGTASQKCDVTHFLAPIAGDRLSVV
jgi:hypothetical protein